MRLQLIEIGIPRACASNMLLKGNDPGIAITFRTMRAVGSIAPCDLTSGRF